MSMTRGHNSLNVDYHRYGVKMAIEMLQEKYARKKNILAEKEGKILLRRPRPPSKLSPLVGRDGTPTTPVTPPSMAGLGSYFSPNQTESDPVMCQQCKAELRSDYHNCSQAIAGVLKVPGEAIKIPGHGANQYLTSEMSGRDSDVTESIQSEAKSPENLISPKKPLSRTPVTEFAEEVFEENMQGMLQVPTYGQNVLQPIKKSDLVYILDPNYATNSRSIPHNTKVPGFLLRPGLPRGPHPFPRRDPIQYEEAIPPQYLHVSDDKRYATTPDFRLDDFLRSFSLRNNIPLEKMHEVFYSRHNYKRITKLLSEAMNLSNTSINYMQLTVPDSDFPNVQPKVPRRQILIEMVMMVKEHVQSHMKSPRTVVKTLPRYQAGPPKARPHTEIIVYDDSESDGTPKAGKREIKRIETLRTSESSATSRRAGMSTAELVAITDGRTYPPLRQGYAHTSQRSSSPFVAEAEDSSISHVEMAILDTLLAGGKHLDLKACFICKLPDISHLYGVLISLNLSFNNFEKIPSAVLKCVHLEALNLRNNPLTHLPDNLHQLTELKELVFSFCLISDINDSLCHLPNLKILDLRYNKLTSLPNSIGLLQTLKELNIEGNQLVALPCGATRLKLSGLNVKNNFMSPILWRDNTKNVPLRLADMAALCVTKYELVDATENQPASVAASLERRTVCDCCGGPRFGPGLRVIRPVMHLFGTKNLPFMFHACGATCLAQFMELSTALRDILYGKRTTGISPDHPAAIV